MSPLGRGDALPDLPLVAPDGASTALASLAGLGGEATLLIFLRHLG